MYKKKSFKFMYEKASRDSRHAKTHEARESSRFKRLSMIRSINDSDLLEEKKMDESKENEFKAPENKKPSRLEMLFKWKQEKQLKKEMEKLNKKQPFKVGGNKNVIANKTSENFKSSFIALPNSSFNSSKFAKSKMGTPNAAIQSSRVPNSKQGASTSTLQLSRNAISKQGTPSTTSQASRIPNSKQTPVFLPKSDNNLCQSNNAATYSRKFPTSVVDKTGPLSKPGSSLSRSNSTITRKLPVSSSTINKVACSKTASNTQKVIPVNRIPNNIMNNTNKSKNLPKPVNKESLKPKSVTKLEEEKLVKKVGTVLPKLTPKATTTSEGIPLQSKMPISNLNKKFGSNSKLDHKEKSLSKDNVSSRKGYCFRTAIPNSSHQQTGTLLKSSVQDNSKRLPENISKNIQKLSTQEVSEQNVDDIPDVTLNFDISIIKPARTSFAPNNFIFQPPEGLNNFIFMDDDYDVFQDLEEVKQKFMSRTSTPSKDSGRKSSTESSKESLGSNKLITDNEKKPDISNSNDFSITELMTPKSKIDNVKADEALKKELVCNKITCEIITNIGIKDANMQVNQHLCKEADFTPNQEANEELFSISPVKVEAKIDKSTNQQTSEKSNSHTNIDLIKIETTKEKVDSKLQCLPVEKQSLYESDAFENSKINIVEINSNEKQFHHSLENEASSRTFEDVFVDVDNDDSLLDSIDLNKIELLKLDDEDTDKDDVPSPHVLKCHERKSNGTIPKRVSMLRKLSVMNSIAETNETDECISVNPAKSSKKNEDAKKTPRRSKRISNHLSADTSSYSPLKNMNSPNITPRRSLRLMKIQCGSDNFSLPSFQEKGENNANSRRSIRLIDFSTPEKAACKEILGENFENLDPNSFLIDFESPTMPAFPKSKVSLLYSPEKRKSMRKSIRGDLITFSPA